jgi:hypothetical protein
MIFKTNQLAMNFVFDKGQRVRDFPGVVFSFQVFLQSNDGGLHKTTSTKDL